MPVSKNAMIAALSSTTLISLAPNVILVLFPQYASGEGQQSQVLVLGQALAAGGLLGDVFLHALPHAAGEPHAGLHILTGFTIFLVVDMFLRSLGSSGHNHSHSHQHGHENDATTSKKQQQQQPETTSNKEEEEEVITTTKIQQQHNHKISTVTLNLVADALHNFTDGLAIGATYSSNTTNHHHHASVWQLMKSRGGLATLSILFHEIPHELGDFAILVQNGFSKQQAIMAQFGTALAALVGTVVGLQLQGWVTHGNSESLVLITSGGFVYLATVTILPDLLDHPQSNFKFRCAQLACFVAGILLLYMVTFLEEWGGHHHQHHHGGHDHGHHPPHPHEHHDHHHHDHQAHEHQHHDHHDHKHHDHGHGEL